MLNRASTCPSLAPNARVRSVASAAAITAANVQVHARFRRLPPPVIVVGMHRSGTSLVSGMLGMLGVYMGPELERLIRQGVPFWRDAAAAESGYGESDDFRGVNDQLLAGFGAGWDRIDPVLNPNAAGPAEAELAETEALRIASRATHGRLRTAYLSETDSTYAGRWGWKDPRSSLTLPVWLALFPRARVLHVRRDRTAAVESLHRRAVAWSRRAPAQLTLRQRASWALTHPVAATACIARRLGLLSTPPARPDPCLERDYCARLYDGYVGACRQYASLGRQYIEVQYEDLLASPQATVRRLVGLLDLESGDEPMSAAARMVRRPAVSTASRPREAASV